MPFYSNVSVFTNMYAIWKGAGSGYGHDFTPVSIPELVHWADVPLAMVHWMVDRQHSSIVGIGRSMTHDTIPLLLRTSISADGVR